MKSLLTFIIGAFMLLGLSAFAPSPVDVDVGDTITIEQMNSDLDLEFNLLDMQDVESEAPGEALKPEADYAAYAMAPVHFAALNPAQAHTLKTQKYRQSAHLDLIKQFNHRLE